MVHRGVCHIVKDVVIVLGICKGVLVHPGECICHNIGFSGPVDY